MNNDELNLLGLIVGIKNYQENVGQSQLQEVTDKQTECIRKHLEEQDKKIDKILEMLQNDKGH